jgi:hypothetical protein
MAVVMRASLPLASRRHWWLWSSLSRMRDFRPMRVLLKRGGFGIPRGRPIETASAKKWAQPYVAEPEVGGNMPGEELAEEIRSSVVLDRGRPVGAMRPHRHPHSAEIAAPRRLSGHRIGRPRGPEAQIAVRMVESVCARLLDHFGKRWCCDRRDKITAAPRIFFNTDLLLVSGRNLPARRLTTGVEVRYWYSR